MSSLLFLLAGETFSSQTVQLREREEKKKKRKQNPVGVVKYQSYLRYREMKFWGSLILFFTVGVPVEWDLLVISIIQIIKVS